MRLVVTTSGKARHSSAAVDEARDAAARLGVEFSPFVRGVPAQALLARADAVLCLQRDAVVLLDRHGQARWTGGMGDLRISRLDRGVPQPDHLLLAGEVRARDAVLDCTLGRGHDALVLERAVGPGGQVTALEASLPLFAWASEGLRRRGSRVACLHLDALAFLRRQPDAAFDVVFFDPMFDRRAHHEEGFSVVKRHQAGGALDAATVAEARRVARRWVVVKAAPQSGRLWRLGLQPVPFARNAELRFGRARGGVVQTLS